MKFLTVFTITCICFLAYTVYFYNIFFLLSYLGLCVMYTMYQTLYGKSNSQSSRLIECETTINIYKEYSDEVRKLFGRAWLLTLSEYIRKNNYKDTLESAIKGSTRLENFDKYAMTEKEGVLAYYQITDNEYNQLFSNQDMKIVCSNIESFVKE